MEESCIKIIRIQCQCFSGKMSLLLEREKQITEITERLMKNFFFLLIVGKHI